MHVLGNPNCPSYFLNCPPYYMFVELDHVQHKHLINKSLSQIHGGKYWAPLSLMLIPTNVPAAHSLLVLAICLGSSSFPYKVPLKKARQSRPPNPQSNQCYTVSIWYLPESQCHLLLMHLPLLHTNCVSGSQVGNSVKDIKTSKR